MADITVDATPLPGFENEFDAVISADGGTVSTPEPGTIVLLAIGLGTLALSAYRRRNA